MNPIRSADDHFSVSQSDLLDASESLAKRAQAEPSLLVERALAFVLQAHSVAVHKDFAHMMLCHADLATGRLTEPAQTEAARSDIERVRVRIASYERALDHFLDVYARNDRQETLRAAVGTYRTSDTDARIDPTQISYWFQQLEGSLKHYFGVESRLAS